MTTSYRSSYGSGSGASGSGSSGFLSQPTSTKAASGGQGSGNRNFLNKYQNTDSIPAQTRDVGVTTSAGLLGKTGSGSLGSEYCIPDECLPPCEQNAYTCCFTVPPGLEDCPALNLDDICATCCVPQKPICSEDPNCHRLRECRRESLGQYCKYLQNRGPRIPSWLAHCGRVLCFYGYFQEPVPESEKENYRIRQVQIRFYMDDGTIDVFEPKTFDPGFKQGKLIRRHKIPLPAPADTDFYTMEDLNVGCEVEFYGKTFMICGCTDSTRTYLNRLGIAVPPNMTMPNDPYTEWRKDRVTSLFSRKARIDLSQGKFKNFLLKGGKVLRFWAFWDDRCSVGGYLRRFILHYFLEDDTVEIKEIPFRTTQAIFPTFLRRGKLFKDYKSLVPPTGIKEEALLILNPTAGGANKNVFLDHSFLEDRLCPGIEEPEHIIDRDLAIGAVIRVYGRAFILTDCDEFTKQYYREKYGIDDFTPLTLADEECMNQLPRIC